MALQICTLQFALCNLQYCLLPSCSPCLCGEFSSSYMETTTILLPLLLVVPLFGAVAGAFIPDAKLARNWALLVGVVTFLISTALGIQFYAGDQPLAFRLASYQISSLEFGL